MGLKNITVASMTDEIPNSSPEGALPLEALEGVNNLNLESHYPDVVSFATEIWNLLTEYLTIFREPEKKFNVEQKVCLLFVSKAARLLRSSWLLVERGYWPEAEIINRAMLELFVEMQYILLDTSGQRAKKWANHTDPKHRLWPFSLMVKEVNKAYGKGYEYYSQYPHNKLISIQAYAGFTQDGLLYTNEGPLSTEKDLKKNADVLGSIAMQCGAVIELAQTRLTPAEPWIGHHKSLYSQPYFVLKNELVNTAMNDPDSKEEITFAIEQFKAMTQD